MLFSDIVNQYYETLNEVDTSMRIPRKSQRWEPMILRRFVIHQNPP